MTQSEEYEKERDTEETKYLYTPDDPTWLSTKRIYALRPPVNNNQGNSSAEMARCNRNV
jgi:hypothetical protein